MIIQERHIDNKELILLAREVRRKLIEMMAHAGSGHPGGSFSIVEILIALYFRVMRVDPKRPDWPGRDKFILSKGHGGPALYVVLAKRGFFPESWLVEFDASGSRLPKHVDRLKTPGVEASTGPLGQGFSMAVGMALAAEMDKENDYRVYCVLSDGENDSGQTWEAAMAASKYRLGNLTAIVDRNRLQVDGDTEDVMPLEPLADKWKAFGWKVFEADGHDIRALVRVIEQTKTVKDKPSVIIAHTVKGKGVSFMENRKEWHADKVTPELCRIALEEIKGGT